MALRILGPGEQVTSEGVTFTFQMSIPDLIGGTRSENDSFHWRWMAVGRIFEESAGGSNAYDGALLIGDDVDHVHALTLPVTDSPTTYACIPRSALEVDPTVSSGLLGKKVKGVKIVLGPELGIAAVSNDEFQQGSRGARRRRESEFCSHFGAPIG